MARKPTPASPRRQGEIIPEPPENRGVLLRVNREGLKALRLLALERDITLQALGIEALNDVLRKYGRRAVVINPRLNQEED